MLVKEYFELEIANRPYKYQTRLNMVRCLKKLELWEMEYETLTPAVCWDRIDGIINQDQLGIQRIYVQAKRYKTGSNISRETIQSFIGALQGASGGVFITTSLFTQSALDFASKHLSPKIVLIDGRELGRLMLKYEIGVIVRRTYKLMEVDENFFSED